MQRLDGIPLGNAAPAIAEQDLDAGRLARILFDCLLGQVAIDGVFHADPHPGNFLLLAGGRIGMLDLGSVGRLAPNTRSARGTSPPCCTSSCSPFSARPRA
ncbi:hypothetical protein EV643_114125 [Kribbella sp. VKM Ac-2527]|uniref:ABC1 atypical kinase-like domain-containing protein n=1 Tax=Kribbella caucasensis TaxID=2512215 RepID=A0A4R6K6H6_9ACTN|nr:AarF/UbiB family protein [Kribbella sp. VKM Ac-2527]TDO44980.1 hypothetical protein EV643_114125 [Kribbella sp. VKM Ac-2527]